MERIRSQRYRDKKRKAKEDPDAIKKLENRRKSDRIRKKREEEEEEESTQ